MTDTSLSTAAETGIASWRAEYAAERQRHNDLTKTLEAAGVVVKLPVNAFSWVDDEGHHMEGVPLDVDMQVRVTGDVYLPSLWASQHHHAIGWLKVSTNGHWAANGTRCATVTEAVAELLRTARAAASIARARRGLEFDIKTARRSYDWRIRWSRRAYATVALLCAVSCIGLPLVWPPWTFAILGVGALLAVLASLCVLDGVEYDKKTLDTYEKWL